MTHWPVRRWIVAGVAMAAVALALAAVTGLLPPKVAQPWWAWPALAVTATLSGLVVASYVPPRGGKWSDTGCSACGQVAIGTVGAAFLARLADPTSVAFAVLAIGLVAGGLLRRLSETRSCPAPTPDASTATAPRSAVLTVAQPPDQVDKPTD